MIVGVHNFVEALARFKDETLSSEGGLWILGMDGLLLIPLAMAAFFYPWVALGTAAALAGGTLLGMALVRAHHRRQLRTGQRAGQA